MSDKPKVIGLGSRVTNDEVTDFIRGYYKPIDPYLSKIRAEGEANKVPIILKETENYLNTFLYMFKPKRILEVGTAIGYSAMYFAASIPEAEVYTIEKDEDMYIKAKENIEKSPWAERIHQYLGDGSEIMDQLSPSFDLIFLDGAKSHYDRFTESGLRLCKSGSIIVADNVLMHGMTVYYNVEKYRKHRTNVKKMRGYLDSLLSDERMESSIMAIGDGLTVSIVK